MIEKLRVYIDSIFENAPKTKQAIELKEEILQNTVERYNDLTQEGKSEEAAFNIAVAGIGDVTEIIESLEKPFRGYEYTKEEIEESRKKSAIYTSVAVMLYILSVLPVIADLEVIGISLMFVMIALATGLIIYNNKTHIRHYKIDDTIVEDFKKWNKENDGKRALRKSISSVVWSLCLAIYFLISFTTMAWHITWVIFPIAAAVDNIIKAIMDLKK